MQFSSLSSRARRFAVMAFVVGLPLASVSMSGCGGGGGGGTIRQVAQNPVTITFRLQDTNGNDADGSVTLGAGEESRTQQSINQSATFTEVTPGTYAVVFTVNGVTTQGTVVVATDSNQTFSLQSGVSNVPNQGITVSGRILLNSGDTTTNNCTAGSQSVTARVVIRVRDVNQPDEPIVTSGEKPRQDNSSAAQQGRYQVTGIPGPGTYVVEVASAASTNTDPNPPGFTGRSPAFTIGEGQTSISGLNICANAKPFVPN
ncbi:MAG TPA: hypothetical protein VF681_03255 [Abditibacteriaceae bacterium]|jgi:hypothetical protein